MVTGRIRRASSSQGTRREAPPAARDGSVASCSGVIDGWSRGLSRKNHIQTAGHRRVASPRITKEPRQDTNARSAVTRGGVNALPIRAAACTMPCAKPQFPAGVQLAMARVAVGKAAPSPKPTARRIAMSDARPPAAPVKAVETATMIQQAVKTSQAPNLSATQPPMSWNRA
jgi:hypothetical protein